MFERENSGQARAGQINDARRRQNVGDNLQPFRQRFNGKPRAAHKKSREKEREENVEIVNFKHARRNCQTERAEIKTAEQKRNDGERREKGSRRTEYDDERQNKQTINQTFGNRPENFAESQRFCVNGRGENRIVGRLINHPKIRAVSHFENGSHQNREYQNARADEREVA